ncbi:hypothetical protein KY348_01935 [Candidatus Woesearchaeota archaeon]|nr:hypothetical protein [Candidatus Woesearchaeota archaeon]
MSGSKGEARKKFFSSSFFILVLLCISLLLSGCPRPPTPVNFFEGTHGLEIRFLEHAPPDEIYENSSFNVNFYVENRGARDVVGENHGILSISFDPFYITTNNLGSANNLEISENGIIFRGIQLPGKSMYYPTGTDLVINIPNFETTGITGQREQPTTQIFSSLCYPYTTQFAHLVCVDLNMLGHDARQQVCYQRDLSLTDQGAPVAITQVQVENQPAGGNVVRPVFTIHVQNKGSGNVLSPAINSAEFERVCTFQELYKEDFNTIDIRAFLSGSKELVCTPNPIRLFEGQGFSRCSMDDSDLTVAHQNYETPLTINLSYVYLTSISKEIKIKRLNVYGDITSPEDEILTYEVQPGVTRCEYCTNNRGGIAGSIPCQPPNAYKIEYQEGFDCKCSFRTCEKLYPKGLCVPFSYFCPGASYCCLPECRSSEVRINGECYPKCSKCPSLESGARRDCACGTEETGYIVVAEGEFCCPDAMQGYPDKESCDAACQPLEEPEEGE